ncbi:ATP-grasp domain-containing protein [Streptomyces sp. NPDC051994]|uniref:ATP-grasp domain-containing protein n=1 Tax=unclassified Streptomyces TaxID=2593676 RepID=UPI003441BB20
MVEPVSSGNRLIADCKALGMEVCVASADTGDRVLSAALRDQADHVLVVDTNDERALEAAIAGFHARHPISALLPGVEPCVPAVIRIAHRMGLRSLPAHSADWVRNKARMRGRAAEAGLRVPRFAQAATDEELAAAGARIGFPAVIKPLDASGSIHVTRVANPAELTAAYRRITEDTRLDLGIATHPHVVVEEYVDGPEFSADGYVRDGRAVICSLTRKLLGPEPYFVELGHIAPSEQQPELMDRVTEYVQSLIEAMGITFGPFHCELRLPGDEPVLIEIAARLPGDRIVDLIELSTGVSLSRIMLADYLGSAPETLDAFGAPRAKCVGIRFFAADGVGRYAELNGWAELAARPEVIETGVLIAPGDEVPPLSDFRGRIAYALFTADSDERAQNVWRELGSAVEVV